jgi:hypothetical protein
MMNWNGSVRKPQWPIAVLSPHLPGRVTENHETLSQVTCVPAETGTDHLSNSSLQLEYLVATVHGKLRSGRAGPFVKVEGCCD